MSTDGACSRGLDTGRRWTALPEHDTPLEWCLDPDGAFLQGPLDLAFFRGRKVLLHLTDEEIGLLVQDNDLRAVYLAGGHILDVGNRTGQVPSRASLLFLAVDRLPALRWTFGNPIDLPGPGRRHIIGSCSLAVNAPGRFFARFLATPAGRQPATLTESVEAAVRQTLTDYLVTACGGEDTDPAGLQSILVNLGTETLSEELGSCGLCCTHLALYTAQPPVEEGGQDPTGHETAGHSPHFSHN